MSIACDIASGDIHVKRNQVTCPGIDHIDITDGTLAVFGASAANSIVIEDQSELILKLIGVIVTNSAPLIIAGGSRIAISTEVLDSSLTATGSGHAAIECDGDSSITFIDADQTLTTVGADRGPGIGTGRNGRCSSLTFQGGTFISSALNGSAAIGTGFGAANVRDLTIHGGTFRLYSDRGAGIGIGFVDEGHAVIDSIRITDGIFDITSLDGPGIGAGHVTSITGESGVTQATVRAIQIDGGTFSIESHSGAGVGSGLATGGGISGVDSLLITGGDFFIAGEIGACVGSGEGVTAGESFVRNVTITNGEFNLTTDQGPRLVPARADTQMGVHE
jgi:hypothetical protein